MGLRLRTTTATGTGENMCEQAFYTVEESLNSHFKILKKQLLILQLINPL